MITNAEFINQPYAGIYEEKVFDTESNDNSQEWSWVRFTNDDETKWCGQFRGFPIQTAVSETYCTILILTSDHLFQLNANDGQLITFIENNECRNLTVSPSGAFIIFDSNTIFRIENNIQLIIPLKSPFRMDLIEFKNWDVGNLLFDCEEFCNWGLTLRMKLNDELKKMNMNSLKDEFLEIIRPLESTELYVTESIEELKKEIYENMIPIGIFENFVGAVDVNDILNFLERVKLNRKNQLLNNLIKVDLIYYVWYDSGAGQLLFNFINANHSKLPFGAKLNLDVSERQIVEAFIEDV